MWVFVLFSIFSIAGIQIATKPHPTGQSDMPKLDHLAARFREMIWRALLRIAALEAEAARSEARLDRVHEPPPAG
jgi:hypothetical protein